MVLVVLGVVQVMGRGHCDLSIIGGVNLAAMGTLVSVILAAPNRSGATSENQGAPR